VWGCKGRFFASQNGVGWCPFNFGSSLPIQSAKIISCCGESIACDFNLSGVLVTKWVESHTQTPANSSLTLRFGLKDFLTNCLVWFKVYIWYASRHYNIDKYLYEIKEQTHTIWILQGFSNKNCAKKMIIFLLLIPKSMYSIRNLMFSFRGFLTLMIGTLCL
jgi:hypothetical protein